MGWIPCASGSQHLQPDAAAGSRRWLTLHRLVYVAAGLGVLHLVWLVKAELAVPLAYAAVLGVLLAARLRVPRTQ